MADPTHVVVAEQLVHARRGDQVSLDTIFAPDDRYRADKWRRLEAIGSIRPIGPQDAPSAPPSPDVAA